MNYYQHGGDNLAYAQSIGCAVSEVIDLSSNINFVQPNINVDCSSLDIVTYPNYTHLTAKIAKQYALKTNQFALFNGASSAIFSLFKFLKPKHCLIVSPNYLEYKKIATALNCHITLTNGLKATTVKQNTLVVISNPTSPFGLYKNINNLVSHYLQQQAKVMVDESFLEFCDGTSLTPQTVQNPNLYIIKSMTKYYGAAGVRIGLIASQADNIKKINALEPAWKLSAFDSHYMQLALSDGTFGTRSKLQNDRAKQFLLNLLKHSHYIEHIYPSDVNFVLVKLKNLNADTFQTLLNPYKILIRNCANFDFLDNLHVRIAVKNIQQLQVLKQAISYA